MLQNKYFQNSSRSNLFFINGTSGNVCIGTTGLDAKIKKEFVHGLIEDKKIKEVSNILDLSL